MLHRRGIVRTGGGCTRRARRGDGVLRELTEGDRELAAADHGRASGRPELAFGHSELAVAPSELAAGHFELAAADRALAAGHFELAAADRALAAGHFELAAGHFGDARSPPSRTPGAESSPPGRAR